MTRTRPLRTLPAGEAGPDTMGHEKSGPQQIGEVFSYEMPILADCPVDFGVRRIRGIPLRTPGHAARDSTGNWISHAGRPFQNKAASASRRRTITPPCANPGSEWDGTRKASTSGPSSTSRDMAKIGSSGGTPTFFQDSAEIFLMPKAPIYYRIAVSAAGKLEGPTRYEETMYTGKDVPNSGCEAVAACGEKTWSVELKIPFAAIGGKPTPGDVWRANMCRVARHRRGHGRGTDDLGLPAPRPFPRLRPVRGRPLPRHGPLPGRGGRAARRA